MIADFPETAPFVGDRSRLLHPNLQASWGRSGFGCPPVSRRLYSVLLSESPRMRRAWPGIPPTLLSGECHEAAVATPFGAPIAGVRLADGGIAVVVSGGRKAPAAPADSTENIEFFEKQVRPLLATRCQKCHSGNAPKGNLRLESRADLMAGGDTGPAVVPGDPKDSLLVDAINYGDTYQMPPKSKLPAEEIAVLTRWVELEAPGPSSRQRPKSTDPSSTWPSAALRIGPGSRYGPSPLRRCATRPGRAERWTASFSPGSRPTA